VLRSLLGGAEEERALERRRERGGAALEGRRRDAARRVAVDADERQPCLDGDPDAGERGGHLGRDARVVEAGAAGGGAPGVDERDGRRRRAAREERLDGAVSSK